MIIDASSIGALATVAAAVISLGAVFVSLAGARRAEHASHQAHGISTLATLQDWRRDVRAWASEVIDILTELEYHLREDGASGDHVSRTCVHRLSASIEKGRYFLPNQDRELYGLSKPTAYRGLRHAALDPLVAALRVGDGAGPGDFDSPAEAVCEMRRLFVSATQALINPDHQNTEIARLIISSHAGRPADRSLSGLLPSEEIPPGAESLLVGSTVVRLSHDPPFNKH